MSGVRNLQEAGIDPGISYTVGETSADKLCETAEWITKEFGVKSLGVNFLLDTASFFVSEDYMKRASQGLLDFFAQTRNSDISESRIMRKVTAFVQHKPYLSDCAACGGQIAVEPNGSIVICQEGTGPQRFVLGSVLNDDFDFMKNRKVQEWSQRSPINMPECLNCPALGICGGGCPYGAMLHYGSIWDVDRRFCVHSKTTLEWLIWDLFDKVQAS